MLQVGAKSAESTRPQGAATFNLVESDQSFPNLPLRLTRSQPARKTGTSESTPAAKGKGVDGADQHDSRSVFTRGRERKLRSARRCARAHRNACAVHVCGF